MSQTENGKILLGDFVLYRLNQYKAYDSIASTGNEYFSRMQQFHNYSSQNGSPSMNWGNLSVVVDFGPMPEDRRNDESTDLSSYRDEDIREVNFTLIVKYIW